MENKSLLFLSFSLTLLSAVSVKQDTFLAQHGLALVSEVTRVCFAPCSLPRKEGGGSVSVLTAGTGQSCDGAD